MGNEVAVRPDNLLDDIRWARALATAGIVPGAYKNNPGNLVVAAQLGRALGIAPIVAVNQIYVVDGKPSASALLIAACVRKAGHRVRITGNTKYATVTIVRKDDPDFEFTVTWELKKNSNGNPSAEEAGLIQKDNWRKYPAGMLPSRALTQCARIACPEALLGVAHTTEELAPDMPTDEHGGAVRIERVSFEDMYAAQIEAAVTTDELKRYHLEAKTAGVLKLKPTGEERTLLRILNDKMRELKASLPDDSSDKEDNESDGEPAAGTGVSEADNTETSPGTGEVEEVHDAEIVEDGE